MRVGVARFASLEEATLGALSVDGRFQCFTLEDEHREIKVPGETRIPAGEYELALRAEGGMHEKYRVRYPEHRGMLWIKKVPGFEWIYLHPGNTPAASSGCLLVGDMAHVRGELMQSEIAYRRIYQLLSNALLAGEPVTIHVRDEVTS
jgi:hypothetical protein